MDQHWRFQAQQVSILRHMHRLTILACLKMGYVQNMAMLTGKMTSHHWIECGKDLVRIPFLGLKQVETGWNEKKKMRETSGQNSYHHWLLLFSFIAIDSSWIHRSPQPTTATACRRLMAMFIRAWQTFFSGATSSKRLQSCDDSLDRYLRWLPSGEHTKSYGKWPLIVDFPMKNGDFP